MEAHKSNSITPSLSETRQDDASSNFFQYANNSPERNKEYDLQDTTESYIAESETSQSPYIRGARVFMAISIVSALLLLAFEIYIYAVINLHKDKLGSNPRYTELSTFLALFIFASVFQMLLSYIGLRSKNLLLLTMLCVFYCCMLVYTGIQYQEISRFVNEVLHGAWKRATKGVNITAIAVIGITLVVQTYMIFGLLRKHVQWIRYKKIGANLKTRQLYLVYQIHRSLLMLDFFFFLGFTVQFIVIMVQDKSSVEFILTVIVLPITILLLIFCDFAITRELAWAAVVAIVILACGCAYVLFKTIRLYTKYTSAYHLGFKPGSYFPGRKSLVTFGVLTLVLLFATMTLELYLICNFHSGLKNVLIDSYLRIPWGKSTARDDESREESLEID